MYSTNPKQVLIEKIRLQKQGFTLIEILVVVLIIGILGAIALPQYQRAVLKSRFAALMPIAKSMADSNEAFYLEHGEYAGNAEDLPVQGRRNYSDGTELEFGTLTGYSYVLATRDNDFPNNYVVYQKHSENYPGEIHCEATEGNNMAQDVCKSFGPTQELGETLTSGYLTYVLFGTGNGEPPTGDDGGNEPGGNTEPEIIPNTPQAVAAQQCAENQTRYICTINANNTVSKCDTNYAIVTPEGECVATGIGTYETVYNEDGTKKSEYSCSGIDAEHCYSGSFYTYDTDGSYTRKDRTCYLQSVISHDGTSCGNNNFSQTCPNGPGAPHCYDNTYDSHGNIISENLCNYSNSDGSCAYYQEMFTYEQSYDGDINTGEIQKRCVSIGGTKCTLYAINSASHLASDGSTNKVVCSDANGNLKYASSYGTCNFTGGYTWRQYNSNTKTYVPCSTTINWDTATCI